MNIDSFSYLVFSGGGPNGLLHIGALQFLELYLHIHKRQSIIRHFTGFAGTSIGALVALLVLSGLTSSQIICNIKTALPEMLSPDSSLFEFTETRAFHGNAKLFNYVRANLKSRFGDDGITFAQLFLLTKKSLHVCACDLQTARIHTFDHVNSPDVKVDLAIVASMAIPFVFPPIDIDGILYVDGGCQSNLPLHIFPVEQTLALWIIDKARPVSKTDIINHFPVFGKQFISLFFNTHDALLETLFLPRYKNNLVILKPFTRGFMICPIADITKPLAQGFHAMFEHLCAFEKNKSSFVQVLVLFIQYIRHYLICVLLARELVHRMPIKLE